MSGSTLVRSTAQWWRSSSVETSSSDQPRFASKKETARMMPRQVVVVNEHNPPWSHQPPKIVKIDEDGIEPVVAVHHRQVKPAALAQQARQGDLRLLVVMFH